MKQNKTQIEYITKLINVDRSIEGNVSYRRACYGIANSIGMRNNELFTSFMLMRFPHEQSYSYIEEWAYRFVSGNPVCYMDKESKEAYIKLLK